MGTLNKIIITTGALLCLTVTPISQTNPLGQYLNTITAQAAELPDSIYLGDSSRW